MKGIVTGTFILFFFCIASVYGLEKVSPIDNGINDGPRPEYVPGEVLVRFKDDVTKATATSVHNQIKSTVLEKFSGIERVKINKDLTVEKAINAYMKDPAVERVQPNFIYYFDSVPNDIFFEELWGLDNRGQVVNGVAGSADADIDAPEAWEVAVGTNDIVVAVIDSGVAYRHPDLAANIWKNPGETSCNDGVDNDGNGYVDDCHGWDFFANDNDPADYNRHGTHVAGIIGAVGNNSEGVTGVNWNTKIMVLRAGGLVEGLSTNAIRDAIRYAVSNGARIINASFGGNNFDQFLYDAIQAAGEAGVLFVAGAGNDATDNDAKPHYPSSFDLPNIIAVAATDQNDKLASFSNYGTITVDVTAPGQNIYSTVPDLGYGPATTLYSTDFESDRAGSLPAGWSSSGTHNTWSVSNGFASSGSNSLDDSPGTNYSNDTDSKIWYTKPIANVRDYRYALTFNVRADLETWDPVNVILSDDQINWHKSKQPVQHSTNGSFVSSSIYYPYSFSSDACGLGYSNNIFFGFRFYSDHDTTYDGVYIDDIQLSREPVFIESYGYRYADGTSMATPYVAGLAALIWSQKPELAAIQVKEIILNSVDVLDNLKLGDDAAAIIMESFDAPGKNPVGLTFDGTYLWNADWLENKIYKLDTSGNVIASFDAPGLFPVGLTFDGTYLWNSDRETDLIYKLDTSGNVITSFDAPGPNPSGLAFDGAYLWNLDWLEDKIYKLDTSGNVIASFDAPGPNPSDIAFDRTYLWCATRVNSLVPESTDRFYKMDLSGNVISVFEAPVHPSGLSFDGKYGWCSDSSTDKIYRLSFDGRYKVSSGGRINAYKALSEALHLSLPMPTSQDVIVYPPTTSPAFGIQPADVKPIGVGSVAEGGDTISLRIGLERFAYPVDIYFGIYAPDIDSNSIFLLNNSNTLRPLSDGFVPWKVNVRLQVEESLFGNISTTSLPSGTYYFYLFVVPKDATKYDKYYLWSTHVIVP